MGARRVPFAEAADAETQSNWFGKSEKVNPSVNLVQGPADVYLIFMMYLAAVNTVNSDPKISDNESQWEVQADQVEVEKKHHDGFGRRQQCDAEAYGYLKVRDSRIGGIQKRSTTAISKR